MNIKIEKTPLKQGQVRIISSKSDGHRSLIAAALAEEESVLFVDGWSEDMEATARCLQSLGAEIEREPSGIYVMPIGCPLPCPVDRIGQANGQGIGQADGQLCTLDCGESGSTLRFLLPVAGALGVDTTFFLHGRLPQRPLSPLWEEMERMGCTLSRPTADTIRCRGKLRAGTYTLSGGVSSQFITGLLLAGALIPGGCKLQITGRLESAPYVDMTLQAMRRFGIDVKKFSIPAGQNFISPGTVTVEGDWSNGAFFLAAEALGSPIRVKGLRPDSPQGDRAAAALLPGLRERLTIDASDIPDLVPVLAVVAACNRGAVFSNIARLRLKESDRVESVKEMICALGGQAEADENRLTVHGTGLTGGTVDARNDHRIAMSAAVAATACKENVTILGAECVEKSYPRFFEEYKQLGGRYEQYLR